MPTPADGGRLIEKRPLEHDVSAGAHRGDGVGLPDEQRGTTIKAVHRALTRAVGDLDNGQPAGPQHLEVGSLVLEPPPIEDLELGILTLRSRSPRVEQLEIQHREVGTGEVPDQIRGAHDEPAVDAIHGQEGRPTPVTAPAAASGDVGLSPAGAWG